MIPQKESDSRREHSLGGDEGDRRKRDRDEGSGKEERSGARVESNNDEMKKDFHGQGDRDSRFSGPGARTDRGMDIGDRGQGFDRAGPDRGPDRGNQNGGGGDRGSDRGNYPSHLQRAPLLPFRGGGGRGGGGPFNDR